MKRTVIKILAAVALIVALMGAEGPNSCRKPVESDRPPEEHQVDPKKERLVFIEAYSDGRYVVLVVANNPGRAGIDRSGPFTFDGGLYKQTLKYSSGLAIEIKVSVEAKGSDTEKVGCKIDDGGRKDARTARKSVTCLLTTSR